MAADYHKRVDFRAFDVMVDAMAHATLAEMRAALSTAIEQASAPHKNAGERLIWGDFAQLIRKHIKRY